MTEFGKSLIYANLGERLLLTLMHFLDRLNLNVHEWDIQIQQNTTIYLEHY